MAFTCQLVIKILIGTRLGVCSFTVCAVASNIAKPSLFGGRSERKSCLVSRVVSDCRQASNPDLESVAGGRDGDAHGCAPVTGLLGALLIPLLSGCFGPEAVNLGMIRKLLMELLKGNIFLFPIHAKKSSMFFVGKPER